MKIKEGVLCWYCALTWFNFGCAVHRMLDELGDDLEQTDNRMEHALGRMDKLLQSNNRCQTWTILMLIFIAVVMFFFIVNSF